MKRNGLAPVAIVALVIIILIIAAGIWHYESGKKGEAPASVPRAATSSIVSAITDWAAYATSSSIQFEADADCAPADPQFAVYLDRINAGKIAEQNIGSFVIMYSPNYYGWSTSQAAQKSRGSFCSAGDPGIVYAYPDKLIWSYGCGGDVNPSCDKTGTAVEDYFKNLKGSQQ